MKWHPAIEFPPVEEHSMGIKRSRNVLIFDGKDILIGHAQQMDSYSEDTEPEPVEWVLIGRDGYRIEGITHWTNLPMPPHGNVRL